MTLDASYKQFVHICVGVLDEIGRGLLRGNSNERDTLVSGLKPDNLGALNRSTTGLITSVSLTLTTFSLLLLLRGGRGRAEKAKCAGEELTRHPLNDSDDMPRKLGLHIVRHPD